MLYHNIQLLYHIVYCCNKHCRITLAIVSLHLYPQVFEQYLMLSHYIQLRYHIAHSCNKQRRMTLATFSHHHLCLQVLER